MRNDSLNMKCLVWIVTVLGILPGGILSLICLRANTLARIQRPSPESGFTSTILSTTFEIGPSLGKVDLSTKTWPAISVLGGIALVIVGTLFLFPQGSKRIYPHGLTEIGRYIRQLLESHNDVAAFVIAKPNSSDVVSMARRGSKVSLFVFSDSNKETRVRAFFATYGIEPGHETLPEGVRMAGCQLEYALSLDAKTNTELIRELFVKLFGVNDSMELEFRTLPDSR